MEMQFVIGGIGLAFAAAIVGVVVLARRRRSESQARVVAERGAQRQTEEVRRCADEKARVAEEREAQRQAEEEARAAAEREAQCQAEEARRRADEQARVAEEREAQHRAAKEALRRVEEEASAAAERERQAEEVARAAAEREAQRRETEEAQRRAEDEARIAAEEEVQRRAAEEAGSRAEEEARAAAERERQTKEEAPAAAERDAQRQAEETCAAAQPEALIETTPVREDTSCSGEETETRTTHSARVGAAARDADSDVIDTPQVAPPAAQPPAPRTPRLYRPTARAPAPQPQFAPTSSSPERETRDRAMPIEVRLVFEKAGFCRVSLLPRRAAGMPIEFAVEGSGSPPELQALQDEWYQDVLLPDIGRLLSEGIEWAGALPGGGAARLSLSGRGVFVLARHGELNGFVTTPRLILGEEHVVLCVAERLPDVRAAIALTESPAPMELNSDSGVPAGWVGLRDVRPKKAVAPSPDGDIINALRPLPDVEISLAGGIRIDRQTWLSGFPPAIELLGDASTLGGVTIDGQEATRSPEGSYVAPGWDSPGDHTVWCTSTSRRYAIRCGAEDWESWDAYAWSLGEPTASGTQSRPAICGVLVRSPQVARPHSRPTVVAASNPILIGARPGEIAVCTPRGDVRAGFCVGFPWFEPIWAIPADALHCDKRSARVLLIGSPVAVDRGDQQPSRRGRAARRRALACGSRAWCEAICAAGRKGLQTEPSGAEIADLWMGYKHYARALGRGPRGGWR